MNTMTPAPPNEDIVARARNLVERKGEMTVELWNDKAQCLMAPMAAEIELLRNNHTKSFEDLAMQHHKLMDERTMLLAVVEAAVVAQKRYLKEAGDWYDHDLDDAIEAYRSAYPEKGSSLQGEDG